MMLETHEFNTAWWGAPTGIVRHPEFFSLPVDQQRELLTPFEWAEFKASLVYSDREEALPYRQLLRAGFIQADTQIHFRIGLAALQLTSLLEPLSVRFADEVPFSLPLEAMSIFRHERFYILPGISAERINRRYAMWGQQIILTHPATCLEVLLDGKVQGWFLSMKEGAKLNLTLAMLHQNASISGSMLYQRALVAYGSRGYRIGYASFHVGNTDVLNIYAHLGARFLTPTACWIWINERLLHEAPARVTTEK